MPNKTKTVQLCFNGMWKVLLILLGIGGVIFTLIQWRVNRSTSNTEQPEYTVIQKWDNIELRSYKPFLSAVVQQSGSMDQTRNETFRMLANYIFGGNDENTKIAMTSPVQMSEEEGMSTMKFMIPGKWSKETLPKPLNEQISFEKQPAFKALVLQYGGFSDREKFLTHAKKLKQFAQQQNLQIEETPIFLGYNPPYQMTDRKNEVIFKVVE